MKYRDNLYLGLTFIIYGSVLLLAMIMCSIIVHKIWLWVFTGILFVGWLFLFKMIMSFVIISEDGITLEKSPKKQVFYRWEAIKYYSDTFENRRQAIMVVLKNDEKIYIDNRRKIKEAIKKYCKDVPDFSDIGKPETCQRYANYCGKLIDLYEHEFELVSSNKERCVFCEEKTEHLNQFCYKTKKNHRDYFICPTCLSDFQKYYRFKIKD